MWVRKLQFNLIFMERSSMMLRNWNIAYKTSVGIPAEDEKMFFLVVRQSSLTSSNDPWSKQQYNSPIRQIETEHRIIFWFSEFKKWNKSRNCRRMTYRKRINIFSGLSTFTSDWSFPVFLVSWGTKHIWPIQYGHPVYCFIDNERNPT